MLFMTIKVDIKTIVSVITIIIITIVIVGTIIVRRMIIRNSNN